MDVAGSHVVVQLRGHGVRLGDLLRLQPGPLQHVEEVRVPAHVELAGPLQPHAPLSEQPGEHAVHDGGTDLRLDVIPDNGQPALFKPFLPVRFSGNEHRDGVYESAARVQDLLDVPFRRLFAPHGQEVDHDVRLRLLQQARDVPRRPRSFLDDSAEVFAKPVMGHSANHFHAEVGDIHELVGVVGPGENRLTEVLPHLVRIDVDGGRELDVPNVIPPDSCVHETGNELIFCRVPIEMHTLNKRRRAVPHADDADSHFSHLHTPPCQHRPRPPLVPGSTGRTPLPVSIQGLRTSQVRRSGRFITRWT